MAMTLTENIIRLTGMPMYCAACRNQDSGVRHVDFDAAVERGFGDGPMPTSMDDLIVCEGCLRTAALLIDMGDLAELRDQLAACQKKLSQEQYRADAADKYAERLEEAFSSRPNGVNVPRRKGRPPKFGD